MDRRPEGGRPERRPSSAASGSALGAMGLAASSAGPMQGVSGGRLGSGQGVGRSGLLQVSQVLAAKAESGKRRMRKSALYSEALAEAKPATEDTQGQQPTKRTRAEVLEVAREAKTQKRLLAQRGAAEATPSCDVLAVAPTPQPSTKDVNLSSGDLAACRRGPLSVFGRSPSELLLAKVAGYDPDATELSPSQGSSARETRRWWARWLPSKGLSG